MSIAQTAINLTGFVVGSTGKIVLQNVGYTSDPSQYAKKATLYLHNDSGCGLIATMKTGQQSYSIPAGAWVPLPLDPGESEVDFLCVYVIQSAPISQLLSTYFAPGEAVPSNFVLGNSPVGGVISNAQIITNTGFPPATVVVFAEPVGDTSVNGALNFNNAGQGTLGDTLYNGSLLIQGTTTDQNSLTKTGMHLFSHLGGDINYTDSYQTITGLAGTVTVAQVIQGSILQKVFIALNGYQSTAGNQTVIFPQSFTLGCMGFSGDIGPSTFWPGFALYNGAAVQTAEIPTSLAVLGGNRNAATTVYGMTWFNYNTAFDRITFIGGGTGASTGFIILEGV